MDWSESDLKECGFFNNEIEELIEYQKEAHLAEDAIKGLKKRPFRLVIAGEYSSGKSAFINWILGEQIAPEEAMRTTALLTEFYYSKSPVYFDTKKKKIKKAEYQHLAKTGEVKGVLRVGYPCPALKDLVLIDSPGTGNNDKDSKLALDAMFSADMIFWLVRMKDGTLRQPSIKLLEAFQKKNADCHKEIPIVFLLTQADLCYIQDVKPIFDQIKKNIERYHIQVARYFAMSIKDSEDFDDLDVEKCVSDNIKKLKIYSEEISKHGKEARLNECKQLKENQVRAQQLCNLLFSRTELRLKKELADVKDNVKRIEANAKRNFQRKLKTICGKIIQEAGENARNMSQLYGQYEETFFIFFTSTYTFLRDGKSLVELGLFGNVNFWNLNIIILGYPTDITQFLNEIAIEIKSKFATREKSLDSYQSDVSYHIRSNIDEYTEKLYQSIDKTIEYSNLMIYSNNVAAAKYEMLEIESKITMLQLRCNL